MSIQGRLSENPTSSGDGPAETGARHRVFHVTNVLQPFSWKRACIVLLKKIKIRIATSAEASIVAELAFKMECELSPDQSGVPEITKA